jgi:uncharacterized protein (DUF169 family)
LVCVGATSKSKVYYEFKVYDTKTLSVISNIKRLEHDKLSFVLLDVTHNCNDPDSLMFIMKEQQTYSIIEVDLINDRTIDR